MKVGDLVKDWRWMTDLGIIVGLIDGIMDETDNVYPREVIIKWSKQTDVAFHTREVFEEWLDCGDIEVISESR